MTVRDKRILRFAWIVLACLDFAVLMPQARSSGTAMTGVFLGKNARFWRRSAFAVVRVIQWRVVRTTNNLGGSWESYRSRVRVLAVLATERMIKTDAILFVSAYSGGVAAERMVKTGTILFVSGYAGVAPLAGPIKPGGTFLVYMTTVRGSRWYLTGDVGVPFMPKGLESVAVTGLSDPLVKKIEAKIEKLIVLAHARK